MAPDHLMTITPSHAYKAFAKNLSQTTMSLNSLQKQAQECAERAKAKLPVKGSHRSENLSEPGDPNTIRSGGDVMKEEVEYEVDYEDSKTTTSYSDDEEDEDRDTPKASGSGRDQMSGKLSRTSADSSQATVSCTYYSALQI